VQSNGFNSNGNQAATNQESWLKQHNRFVFIIFVGLILLGLLIWYVVRSVKGMRKRLEQENAAQLYMMQQATPQNSVIPENLPTPPPAYKTRENTPL
jgi:flagellar biosynthesis/type III secretory pathway M-ring protein FliF/YscJ